MKYIATSTIALTYALFCASGALAQQTPPQETTELGGDIVVTAQKRQQSVQDVGIAITAYSGTQLKALGVIDTPDLAAFSPGVHISGNLAGQNTQYSIRGVTQNDFNDIVEAPNAVYLDEGYIAVAQGQTFALFDIARVEILKGPQGTLFGRNATGGLIHYVTTKPSLDKIEGFIDVNYGLHDSPGAFRGEAALNIPLGTTLALRGALTWSKRDPLLRNLYPAGAVGGSPGPGAGANLGDDDTLAGRLTALFQPSDSAQFTLQYNGARSRLSTGAYQQKPTIAVFNAAGELINVIDVAPGETRASIAANGSDRGSDLDNNGVFGDSFGRPRAGGDFFGYIDADGADFTTSSDFAFAEQGHIDTWGLDLTGTIDLSDTVTLTTVSDYKKYGKLLFVDVDSGPGNQSANYAAVDATQFSQELRLSGTTPGLTWVAGLYYLNIDALSRNGLKFPVGSVVPGAPFDLGTEARLKTNSYSAFAQTDVRLAPKLSLILGGRIIREQKDYDFFQGLWFTTDSRQVQQGTPTVIGPNPTGRYTDKRGDTLWAGKVQIEYRPTADLLLYAGINRGAKAGSYNAQLAGGLAVPVSAIPYKAETLVSYEGGFKFTLPDGRTRINASLFHYDYSDYQAFLFTGVSGVVINADARTNGVEADVFTTPVPGLNLGLSASYFDAVVKDVPLRIGGPIRRDVKPTYAPQFQASVLARYEWDMGMGKASIGGDAQYSSSYYYNLRNFDADIYPSYIMLNLGVGYRIGAWSFDARVRNLTDRRVGIQGFDLASFCGCNEVSYKAPRFFQLAARYTF